jgi:hypothetical protein
MGLPRTVGAPVGPTAAQGWRAGSSGTTGAQVADRLPGGPGTGPATHPAMQGRPVRAGLSVRLAKATDRARALGRVGAATAHAVTRRWAVAARTVTRRRSATVDRPVPGAPAALADRRPTALADRVLPGGSGPPGLDARGEIGRADHRVVPGVVRPDRSAIPDLAAIAVRPGRPGCPAIRVLQAVVPPAPAGSIASAGATGPTVRTDPKDPRHGVAMTARSAEAARTAGPVGTVTAATGPVPPARPAPPVGSARVPGGRAPARAAGASLVPVATPLAAAVPSPVAARRPTVVPSPPSVRPTVPVVLAQTRAVPGETPAAPA